MEKPPNDFEREPNVMFFYVEGTYPVDSFKRSVMFFSRLEDITLQFIDLYAEEHGEPPSVPVLPIYRFNREQK